MRQVVQLLGQPEDCMLHAGIYTKKYFIKVKGPHGSMWRLKEQLSFATVSEVLPFSSIILFQPSKSHNLLYVFG